MNRITKAMSVGAFTVAFALPVLGQTVKVTPLGTHDGEFCALVSAGERH